VINVYPPIKVGNAVDPSNTEINDPYVAIGTLPKIIYEDDLVQLNSEIGPQEGDITDYTCEWNFGDGTSSFERAPIHSWSTAGVYPIILYVTDKYGNIFIREKEITVEEKAPEILGPFSFQGIEGKAIILDVEVYDALLDQPSLKFEWYDQKNEFFTSRKKPSIILDNGNYKYTFKVTDPSGLSSTCEINIVVLPIAPEIYVPNYMYYGPPGDKFSSDDVGRLTLRAYSYDCAYDLSELRCRWLIKKGTEKFTPFEYNDGNCSEVTFKCRETAIYQGQVRVDDPSGNTRIATFEIFSFVDEPEDESIKQLEQAFNIRLSAPEDSKDSDNDNLSDMYEIEVSGTNPFDPDTDNDKLYDGFDDSGVGEQTLGTSPTNSDSDFDGLEDGLEYWGWDISIDYFENSSIVHVTSDPLSSRTDSDYLSDYEEYLAKSHPRLYDSDSDYLEDHKDPFPTSWDYDEDGLSDYMETIWGTNMSDSDTDKDGLTDGEERIRFQTDPTRAD
jgi:PKD repeat protein